MLLRRYMVILLKRYRKRHFHDNWFLRRLELPLMANANGYARLNTF
jgi:hypothetical protein